MRVPKRGANPKTTERANELLSKMEAHFTDGGYFLTVREVAAMLSTNSTSVTLYYLNILRRRGLVMWEPFIARTIRLVKENQ